MSDSLPPQAVSTTNNDETAATAPNDPPQPTPTNNSISEPPKKRMKVDGVQLPHYNSHNIYSRPPIAPGANSNTAANSGTLPTILPPVSPLTFMQQMDANTSAATFNTSIAPQPAPTETWPLCAYCGKNGDLSRCSSCRQAYYCNRECQVAHWEVHSIVCHPGPPQPPNLPKHGQAVAPPPPRQRPQYAVYQQSPQFTPRPRYQQKPRTSASSGGSIAPIIGADGREQYYCEECDRYFKNGQALGGHRSRVHSSRRNGGANGMNGQGYMGPNGAGYGNGGQYVCPPVYSGTPSSSSSIRKVKKVKKTPKVKRNINHVNGAYVCPHCGRTFSSGNALGGHISGAHTKKARKLAEQQAMYAQQQRYARPNMM